MVADSLLECMEVADGAWRCVVMAYVNLNGRLGGYCRLHLVEV